MCDELWEEELGLKNTGYVSLFYRISDYDEAIGHFIEKLKKDYPGTYDNQSTFILKDESIMTPNNRIMILCHNDRHGNPNLKNIIIFATMKIPWHENDNKHYDLNIFKDVTETILKKYNIDKYDGPFIERIHYENGDSMYAGPSLLPDIRLDRCISRITKNDFRLNDKEMMSEFQEKYGEYFEKCEKNIIREHQMYTKL